MIYVFLASGFESSEAIVSAGLVRRAKIDLSFVGVDGQIVESMYGPAIKSDISIDKITYDNLEGIILPGGMPGASNLEKNQKVIETINYCIDNNLLVCAICAAPSILGKIGVLSGKKASCYPGFEKYLSGASISHDPVCVDGNIITSRGPGTALLFGLTIVEKIKGKLVSNKIKEGIIYPY